MAETKKKVEEELNQVDTVTEPEAATQAVKSEAYQALEAVFEAYKKQNPVKYELKKEGFAKQLSELK